jgi:Adenosylmethionine-8-amino-7-oxononanoate aminotransferase
MKPGLMGAGGMKVTSMSFYKSVRELTKQYGVHLISDEVATGFGRSGELFVSKKASVSPDFMCLSKGLTNGQLPLAVTLTTNEIYNTFYGDFNEGKTFYHGHTFTANPLGCAVGLAAIDLLETLPWKKNVALIESQLKNGVVSLVDTFSFVNNPRVFGSVAAVDVSASRDDLFLLSQQGFKLNLCIRPLGNTIYLYLPIMISTDDVTIILNQMNSLFDWLEIHIG